MTPQVLLPRLTVYRPRISSGAATSAKASPTVIPRAVFDGPGGPPRRSQAAHRDGVCGPGSGGRARRQARTTVTAAATAGSSGHQPSWPSGEPVRSPVIRPASCRNQPTRWPAMKYTEPTSSVLTMTPRVSVASPRTVTCQFSSR